MLEFFLSIHRVLFPFFGEKSIADILFYLFVLLEISVANIHCCLFVNNSKLKNYRLL